MKTNLFRNSLPTQTILLFYHTTPRWSVEVTGDNLKLISFQCLFEKGIQMCMNQKMTELEGQVYNLLDFFFAYLRLNNKEMLILEKCSIKLYLYSILINQFKE